MASFPSAATSVFQGMAAPLWASLQSLPRPLPKFKLVPTSRPAGVATQMSTVIEGDIIPRLALAHPIATEAKATLARHPVSPETLVGIVLERDGAAAGAFVTDAMRAGAQSESLFDDLLAPTALLLTDMWRDDRLSHTEVTIGLTRLQRIVRGLPHETAYNGENDDQAKSALFAPRPGEQQTFGFYMIEERFRWGGWRTWIETTSTREELVANVRSRWFDMVCLSVSRGDDLDDLSEVIGAIRRASRNRGVLITVDGAHFSERPDRVSIVGADASASCGGRILQVEARDSGRAATA
jgi:methanogenic corrinoid protein MtbC1